MTYLSNGESTERFDEMLGFLTCHAYVKPVPLKQSSKLHTEFYVYWTVHHCDS